MEINIAGLDAVLQNLRQLNIDESLENKALTKAGKITQVAIEKEAPIDKKNLADSASLHKNIKLKRPKDGEVLIHTGGAYHGHLVEFGRSGGSAMVKKKGKLQKVTWGPTSANPFFSRGFESSNGNAKQAMIEEIQRGLGL